MSDLIDRQAAINEIERAKVRVYHSIERAIGRSITEILDEVEKDVRGLPPSEPKRGRWVLVCDNNGMHFICNKCGAWRYHQEQKFCGECGADMR